MITKHAQQRRIERSYYNSKATITRFIDKAIKEGKYKRSGVKLEIPSAMGRFIINRHTKELITIKPIYT